VAAELPAAATTAALPWSGGELARAGQRLAREELEQIRSTGATQSHYSACIELHDLDFKRVKISH
jgi:hypothetical protein